MYGYYYGAWGASVTFTGNVAAFNGGHGLNIVLGVPSPPPNIPVTDPITDGGHNMAFGNAINPQCVGVVCGP